MPIRRSRKLIRAMDAAVGLSPDELRALDEWLHLLIEKAKTTDKKARGGTSRIVVEERKTPTGTYRLELVKCGKPRCGRCAARPAHGPYWYVYWKQDGRTRSKYIGKELKTGK